MLSFNPKVQSDLKAVIRYYDAISEALGDEFFAEFNYYVEVIRRSPTRFPFSDEPYRKVMLKKFPYAIAYKTVGSHSRILVLKHKRRRQYYGLSRK
tara:strand:+ start:182 stop:469 length:288 start_codon:yes stop_codon:yes gene_type:complete